MVCFGIKNCQAYIKFADKIMRMKLGRGRMKPEINKGILCEMSSLFGGEG
jgi:hypothetical protein